VNSTKVAAAIVAAFFSLCRFSIKTVKRRKICTLLNFLNMQYQERFDKALKQLTELEKEISSILQGAAKDGELIVGYRKAAQIKAFLTKLAKEPNTSNAKKSAGPPADLFKAEARKLINEPRRNPTPPDFFSKFRNGAPTPVALEVEKPWTVAEPVRQEEPAKKAKKKKDTGPVLATNVGEDGGDN